MDAIPPLRLGLSGRGDVSMFTVSMHQVWSTVGTGIESDPRVISCFFYGYILRRRRHSDAEHPTALCKIYICRKTLQHLWGPSQPFTQLWNEDYFRSGVNRHFRAVSFGLINYSVNTRFISTLAMNHIAGGRLTTNPKWALVEASSYGL